MWRLDSLWLSAIILISLHYCNSKRLPSKPNPRIEKLGACLYKNNQIGIQFNFENLSNSEYVIHLKNSEEKISLQLCKKPLKNLCNNKNAYVCLHRRNKEIILGRESQYNDIDGKMTFNYTGENCKNNKPYTVNIVMICNIKATKSAPEILPHPEDQCAFEMIWKTNAACGVPPYEKPPVNCTVTDKAGNVYDLSSLTNYSDNYIVPIKENVSIILNVCHPIIYGHGAVCPYTSSVCLRHSHNISYNNLGDVSSPIINKDKIQLNYTNGFMCPTEAFTLISFICDEQSHNRGPYLTGVRNNCYYYLSWKTDIVCKKKTEPNTKDSCIAFNPKTKLKYDLKSLMIKDQILQSPEGIQYKVRLCAPLLTHSCQSNGLKADAGVCSALNLTIGGKANSNFLWSVDGVTGPYLNYTDGSPCGNQNRRYTLIQFSCTHDDSKNLPVIVEDKACHLRIQWNTSLVCNEKSINYLPPQEPIETSQTESFELGKEQNTVINESPSTTPIILLQTSEAAITINKSNETTYVSTITISILLAICGSFVLLYLLNSRIKGCINSLCCSRCFKKSNIRMQYSKINTGPEMDSLLDAPDTLCQSEDSDDDLLRI